MTLPKLIAKCVKRSKAAYNADNDGWPALAYDYLESMHAELNAYFQKHSREPEPKAEKPATTGDVRLRPDEDL